MNEPTPAPTAAAPTSLGTIIMNVFASPREAFTPLAGQPVRHSLWVLPLLVTVVLVVVTVTMMFTHETFKQQMRDAQIVQMDKAVADGKMTREQADMAAERMGGGGALFIVIGAVFGGIFVALAYLVAALALWLGSKLVLKSTEGYQRHLEVYGIASWIGLLGGVVTLLMMLGLDSLYATPSGALAVFGHFEPGNKMHLFLRMLDIFGAWQAVAVGIGIAAVAGKDSMRGIAVAVVLWFVWIGAAVGLGLAR